MGKKKKPQKDREQELYKLAVDGNTEGLLELIEKDKMILDRVSTIRKYSETPLHVAAMMGHQSLVSKLLELKPQLATELDYRRSSPLHVAASREGNVSVVKELLKVNPDMCLAQDKDGRNPLHIAAMRGRTDALKEILLVKPEAADALVNENQTILHLCVKYLQFEALKFLLETLNSNNELTHKKDKEGNTPLC